MKKLVDCTTTETSKIICRDEENKIICFTHAEYEISCDIIAIDKCVFNKVKGERKCDFLFLFDKNKQPYKFLNNKKSLAYYVELKGIDLESACEQLKNSIEKTKDQLPDFDINAFVVSSREFNPRYDNNEYYRAVKRLIKKDIQFKLSPHTENL